ncbi:MAG: putative polyhydroxyalkanoate system protein [Flavobacteriales bacterium]|jgi:putative polyhydroxyalkanoate system protein
MADIDVVEKHNCTPAEALTKIAGFNEMMAKYGVKPKWKGHRADIKGIGVKGFVEVRDEDVQVHLTLGMVAKAAGIKSDKLEASIRKRLVAAFAE